MTPPRRDTAVVILQADHVVYINLSIRSHHHDAAFLRRQAVDLSLAYADHFPLAQRYREHLFALADGRGRVAFDKEPPLFAVVVVLQAQTLLRLYINGLKIPLAPLVPSVIFSPRADGLGRRTPGVVDHPGGRLDLAALYHIENHFDAELLAQRDFRNILGDPVAAVRKYRRPDFRERTADAFVGVPFFVVGENYPVDERQVRDDLGALFLRHEDKALLRAQPVVVVHDNDGLAAEPPRLAKHPHVPDVQRVNPAGNGNPNRLLSHHGGKYALWFADMQPNRFDFRTA